MAEEGPVRSAMSRTEVGERLLPKRQGEQRAARVVPAGRDLHDPHGTATGAAGGIFGARRALGLPARGDASACARARAHQNGMMSSRPTGP